MTDSATDPQKDTPPKRRRSGGRASHAGRRSRTIAQPPWQLPVNRDAPTEPLSQEAVERVHDATMRVLETIGIEFLNPKAVRILKKAGCRVDGENVRMDRDFVMEMVGKAPRQFTVTPRNPDRTLPIGSGHLLFGNVSSPPNYWDLEIGRKVPGTRAYFRNLIKLSQHFNCIHFCGGYPVEPVDLHPKIRHLDAMFDKLTLCDKAMHVYSLGTERVRDGVEMVRIAGGLSHEEFAQTPRMYTNINSTSPLKHDHPMLDGWMQLAELGQGLVVTPFTLAGAMAPVTMAGAVVQSLAEALAAVVLAQVIRPGAPCMIGTFTSNVDMKTGAPAFGTPEYMRATQMTGQMARFYGLPLRSSAVCAANVPDGQSVWETEHSLWAAIQSGTDMVYHAAGWLEGGLIASPEKFIMDCEILQQIQRYMQPDIWDDSDAALAVDTIAEVGPNGHFFGVEHTQERYETAFYQPFLSDWKNHEAWEASGAMWTPERAHSIYKQILETFEEPSLPEDRLEELTEFVERRKAEGGVPTDF